MGIRLQAFCQQPSGRRSTRLRFDLRLRRQSIEFRSFPFSVCRLLDGLVQHSCSLGSLGFAVSCAGVPVPMPDAKFCHAADFFCNDMQMV